MTLEQPLFFCLHQCRHFPIRFQQPNYCALGVLGTANTHYAEFAMAMAGDSLNSESRHKTTVAEYAAGRWRLLLAILCDNLLSIQFAAERSDSPKASRVKK